MGPLSNHQPHRLPGGAAILWLASSLTPCRPHPPTIQGSLCSKRPTMSRTGTPCCPLLSHSIHPPPYLQPSQSGGFLPTVLGGPLLGNCLGSPAWAALPTCPYSLSSHYGSLGPSGLSLSSQIRVSTCGNQDTPSSLLAPQHISAERNHSPGCFQKFAESYV